MSTVCAVSIYVFLYILYLVFLACTPWITVLLGVQDELGLAKWRCFSCGRTSHFLFPQPFSPSPQALNPAHANPYSRCYFQSIVSASCGSKVWKLGCCRGRWKAGLIVGPTQRRMGKSVQCAAGKPRFGQQLFLDDEIIICTGHGWKSTPHPHPRRIMFCKRLTLPCCGGD